jgi:hypothetical protein
MKKYISVSIVVTVLIVVSFLTYSSMMLAQENSRMASFNSGLLINGDFDQLGFYFRPPNHFVADSWFQWWGDYTNIPEYIDGGHPHHNQCYPNPPNTLCHNDTTQIYNNSQGLIRYGYGSFFAGIYKPVENVYPCALYTFEIWNRNDADGRFYHPTIGIEPTGWIITQPSGNPLWNCPPDGASECPDPYVDPVSGFPSTMIWSNELTQPAYVWGKGSLTAESLNSTISVWTYTNPDEDQVSKSTYWDYGSVVHTPFSGDKLPAPATFTATGFVYNVSTSYQGSDVVISWMTLSPASSQVWYNVRPLTTPMTPTAEMTQTVFVPVVQHLVDPEMYPLSTPIDYVPKTSHQVHISGLADGDTLTFVPLSRYPSSSVCTTMSDSPRKLSVNLP